MATANHKAKDHNVKLSKSLSWLLRHGAEKEGFTLQKGGFLYVDDILKHPRFNKASISEIRSVVENNDKQRFALETDHETGKIKIRANQGHSLQVNDLELTPVTDPDLFPVVIHGTNKRAFQFISHEGLKRMNRNHMHFAAGEPGENGVISGMRQSCSVIIYINLRKSLNDGFKFFQSANGVILCSGNDEGILPTTYFDKVLDRTSRKKIPFIQEAPDQSACASESLQVQSGLAEQGFEASTVSADDLADEWEGQKRRGKKKKVMSSVELDEL